MTTNIQNETTNPTDNTLVTNGDDVIINAEDAATDPGTPVSEEAIQELTPATESEPVIGDQVIIGTGGDDILEGGEGDDTIRAGRGNDTIFGNGGNDEVRADRGNDTIFGGAGDDFLRGEDGDDVIDGGEGADTIAGGDGRDTVSYAESDAGVQVALNIGSAAQSGGHAEGDILRTVENVTGSVHDDVLTGNSAANVLLGGDGDDVIDSGTGRDTVDGGAGDDLVIARDGAGRSFDGGEGFDTLRVLDRVGLKGDDEATGFEALEIVAAAGRDALLRIDADQMTFEEIAFQTQNDRAATIEISINDATELNLAGVKLMGFDADRDVFDIIGNGEDNRIITTNLRDEIAAGRGDDFIKTRGGDDDVRAGSGDDRVFGGAGDDFLRGDDGNDVIKGGQGADTIEGGRNNDAIFGGGGDDILRGQNGDDEIAGGKGADRIEGGIGRDTVTYRGSKEGVTVSLAQGAAPQSGGDAEGDVLLSIENVTGSGRDDTLTGSDGANVLDGGAGDDVIEGRGGADTVLGRAGDDLVIVRDGAGRSFDGGKGFDTLRVLDRVGLKGDDEAIGFEALEIVAAAGRDALLRIDADEMTFEQIAFQSQNGRSAIVEIFGDGATAVDLSDVALSGFDGADEFRFFGAAGDDSFTGTALADRIEGRAGNDTLDGGAGDDTIEGGDGNDVLIGGAGGDRLIGGNGTDRVDYSASEAGIDIVLDNGNRFGDGGDAGGDRLSGIEDVTASAFDDLVRGSNAANRIEAGAGDDTIDGLGGSDRLDGGAGNDVLSGGGGDDLLIGGAGDDILSGGTGADTFDFTERLGFGDDRVEDFARGDLIRLLEEDDVSGFEDLVIAQQNEELANGTTRTDTVIELENGTITLEGVDFTLQASDFEFL